MMRHRKITSTLLVLALILVIAALACGSSSDESDVFARESAATAPRPKAFPAAPAPAPAPSAPSAPAAAAVRGESSESTFRSSSQTSGLSVTIDSMPSDLTDEDISTQSATGGTEAQFVSQRRIIIRTVEMLIVVSGVAASIDEISDLAKRFEGWVVSSNRSLTHRGAISIRIPSDKLDEVIMLLRGMAQEVESEVSTSRDVTDEYVDLQSRLTNQRATENALLKLLERAETVEAALNVQRELTRVQEEIERMLGRVKFLEETSAFSLVTVQLKLSPTEMPVDAGDDQTVSTRVPARFRATFEPPEGIEDFTFTWDFGDGSEPVFSSRTAPTIEDDKRVTATITHIYSDVKNSPYIVEIEMNGFGETGVTEGSDILIVTVTNIPTVEVFAGQGFIVDQGEIAEFSGSFTRPEGLTNVNYKWDFGDGTAPETGSVTEGVTRVATTHVYQDFRPLPFQAVLTITADSEVGELEIANAMTIVVREKPTWTVAGWDAGDTGRTAVRTLSGVGAGLATAAIWIGIFSPVWIVVGGLAYISRRRWLNRPARHSQSDTEES